MSSSLPGFQQDQAKKAVTALFKYVGKQAEKANDLLEEDEIIYLLVALKKVPPPGPRKDKPIRLPVPHSLYDFDGAEVCLIVKDHKGEGHKAAKERVRQQQIAKVAKVIGLSKLKAKYEPHEAKRQLCAAYDLFVADERIIPSLPKLLGKTFFKKKKQPIPVDLRGSDWAGQIEKARQATYMYGPAGSSINIRVARSSFTEAQCLENIVKVLTEACKHIPKKWANVQAVYLKTADSVALPIYQRLPDQAIRIDGAPAAEVAAS